MGCGGLAVSSECSDAVVVGHLMPLKMNVISSSSAGLCSIACQRASSIKGLHLLGPVAVRRAHRLMVPLWHRPGGAGRIEVLRAGEPHRPQAVRAACSVMERPPEFLAAALLAAV